MGTMTDDKLSLIPTLSRGTHKSLEEGACLMEAVAFVAGERWSDHPKCTCPVLSTFLRAWNDALPDDERDILLRPLIPRLIGTKGSPALEHRRSLMAADWLVRVHTPAWLRLAGLTVHADALAALPEITDTAQTQAIRSGPIAAAWTAARDAAWTAADAMDTDAAMAAAMAAARAAGGDAAWNASWDATSWAAAMDERAAARASAAWNAAMDARATGDAAAAWAAAMDARAAAWDSAAWDAAMDARAAGRAAAEAAARGKLSPTRMALQQSALALVNRMIALKESETP